MRESKGVYGIECFLLFLIGLTSSFYIIQINGQPICIWLMFLMVAYVLITKRSLVIKKENFPFLMFYICIVLSLFAQAYITGTNIYSVLVIFFAITLFSVVLNGVRNKELECFVKGLKLSLIVQLAWCVLQYMVYLQTGIDINNLIFVDTLHLVEMTSRTHRGTYIVTGLCWHPSNLVFVLILFLLFYLKWYSWVLCILVALLSENSTLIISILAVASLLCISKVYEIIKKNKIKFIIKNLGFFVISALVLVMIFVSTGLFSEFVNQIEYVWLRATGGAGDTSSSVHMNYYLRYLDIVKKSNLYTVLFGYGYGYSGYPITKYYGQYSSLNSWTVESDIMNILYGTGIVGFIIYYTWFLRPIRKAAKIDMKYVIMLLALVICGITYNNQMSWVIIDEILIFECIRRNLNIFEIRKEKR